jgi:hypothetical protein
VNIIRSIICLIVLLPACVNEHRIEAKKVDLNSNCELMKSEIIGKLSGECAGDEYKVAENRMISSDKEVYQIATWDEFLKFKKDRFTSNYFETISKDYFELNTLGVVLVTYGGSNFIKNEKLYKENNSCGFSYERWDRKMAEVPACVFGKLYVIKLKNK